ncbi:hypothetical protein [Mammaliicoccus lentus]|uniref:hypothetical protein n=1 Tax=Mammaliicoccus lentus TaxID=42858 RepID=UPI001072560E|nr:hypothetical protein [Mammaliicoccus lentus]MBF0793400.1 hypothetical protein [Mammaliicoccus lentus]TFV17900.1 hypothetical protein E4T78_01950 [Mammaliicoccus lentus]
MTIKTNMTTEQKFERFQNMVSDKLEILKDYKENQENIEENELFGAIVELTSMIYTTKELTEITEQMINEYIYIEIGFSIDDLQDIENSFH